jgi:hypothetical protein
MLNSKESVEEKLWSKDESLSKIIDLILDVNVLPKERELLILAKDKMINEKVVPNILAKLQAGLESIKRKNDLSLACLEFYKSIPIKLEDNPFSHQNSASSYLKEIALDLYYTGGGHIVGGRNR